MTKELKRKLIELGVGIVLYIYAIFSEQYWHTGKWETVILFLLPYLTVVGELLRTIWTNTKGKKYFDENILILLATVGAFLCGKNAEAVGVLLFYQMGKLFEHLALRHSQKSIEKFMDIRPDYANRRVRGQEVRVDPSELKLRNIIIVKPGERIPVDAVIVKGNSTVNTMALTGESVPHEVREGDRLYSGSINLTGLLEARVTKLYGESTVSKILDLVQNANNRKSDSENFVTRFNKWYTPIVTLLGFAVMIIPSVTFAPEERYIWVYRGLIFLVTACPCGLILSVPLAFFGGIGAASRQGVVVKGANFLENLAKTETFVFDKTGTLTKGVFVVKEYHPRNMSKEELLELMAYGEIHSNHPIAQSLREAYGKELDKKKVKWVKEYSGFGVRANIEGRKVYIGNSKFMRRNEIVYSKVRSAGTAVHLAVDGVYAGYILIADTLREDAKYTISQLRHHQMILVMLTGDNERVAKSVARELGIENVFANLMPEGKVEQLQEFMDSQLEEEKLVFVGDGINDAPVLAMADVGIAMGGLGSDAAIEAADIVLMKDEPSGIIKAIRIAKETLSVVKENMVFAIGIKVILLVFAIMGYVSMRDAIVADMVVLAINLLNSLWVLRYPEQ
ncbi:heavy metal translocating P-type ATPase [Hespellia stercorisuis]|uniref:Cd(2+)-exporting ATPase n=1 Tax=Hespellia stercorisuis DSM 15480 TaxID=1121950 RepID=A0A1M6LBD0_9FIRM|nr:heavy metal translocating P-type ATPase [Hespellia stercorisuis]SHJ68478.1 Cd2+/Zn2+-exporting ATPase [Hespellia stercorisuis DSM 15480]